MGRIRTALLPADLLATQSFTQVYRSLGASETEQECDQSDWQSELQKGENEKNEFKPFIIPMDTKESKIVKTTLAFANTDGGTILEGVENEGVRLGANQARKCFKSEDPIDAQMARIEVLISKKTPPVPSIPL
jgi:predicted HTH transcriptional regulator